VCCSIWTAIVRWWRSASLQRAWGWSVLISIGHSRRSTSTGSASALLPAAFLPTTACRSPGRKWVITARLCCHSRNWPRPLPSPSPRCGFCAATLAEISLPSGCATKASRWIFCHCTAGNSLYTRPARYASGGWTKHSTAWWSAAGKAASTCCNWPVMTGRNWLVYPCSCPARGWPTSPVRPVPGLLWIAVAPAPRPCWRRCSSPPLEAKDGYVSETDAQSPSLPAPDATVAPSPTPSDRRTGTGLAGLALLIALLAAGAGGWSAWQLPQQNQQQDRQQG